ncbi:MAG: hypothetical protein OEM29_04885 [Thermoplasmata archaeon]|nr:hypothetical protein [Thermoplasmata archaeon]
MAIGAEMATVHLSQGRRKWKTKNHATKRIAMMNGTAKLRVTASDFFRITLRGF